MAVAVVERFKQDIMYGPLWIGGRLYRTVVTMTKRGRNVGIKEKVTFLRQTINELTTLSKNTYSGSPSMTR